MNAIEYKDLPLRVHCEIDGQRFTLEMRRDARIVFWNHTANFGGVISVPYWPGHKDPIKSFFIRWYERHRFSYDKDADRLRGSELPPLGAAALAEGFTVYHEGEKYEPL